MILSKPMKFQVNSFIDCLKHGAILRENTSKTGKLGEGQDAGMVGGVSGWATHFQS
jgi:hypothetical protein